jgi:UDP-glucose 4-epimerase
VSDVRVLVTGGSGFIGRHVVAALTRAGGSVRVADHVAHDGADVPTVVGDLADPEICRRAVEGIDAIVHLAALTSVLGSIERPVDFHRTNVEATAHLLEAARQAEVGSFVFASSNAVVGDVGSTPITEDIAIRPLTPYGATKAAAEMLIAGYAGAYGLRAPVLRFSNVYGEGMRHKDSFIPRLMRAAAEGGEVQIFGDGEQKRDLVYVGDLADGVVRAVESWPSGPVGIGAGRSYTVNEIADAAREATGRPIGAVQVPAKPGEMPAVVVDVSKARGLGYEPRMPLVDGLRRVWPDFATAAESPVR